MRLKQLLTAVCVLTTACVQMNAQNPIIRDQFSADPTARVFGDKIYVYPSHDIKAPEGQRQDWFCMEDYHVFSSSDLTEWTDHGMILNQEGVPWGNPKGYAMWAPDCVEKKGKYYFYFPNAPKSGMGFGIGVCIADSPTGPFKPQAEPMQGARGIDPCVMQTSDGSSYLFFGGGSISVAKLSDDMLSIVGQPQRIQLPSGFVEGPFAFERNGKFYLTYPWVRKNNGTETLAYAIADNPMGPYEHKGLIMEEHENGCWTNHHSIVNYKGQYYLFYHHNDYSPKFDKNRSVCADSLTFNSDGTIKLVKPTKRGIGISNASKPVQIDRYSEIGSGATIEYLDTTNYFLGWETVFPKAGAWVQYNKVEAKSTAKTLTVRLKSSAASNAILELLPKYKAEVKLPNTNGQWQEVKVSVKSVAKGMYDLKFTAGGKMEIDWVSLN